MKLPAWLFRSWHGRGSSRRSNSPTVGGGTEIPKEGANSPQYEGMVTGGAERRFFPARRCTPFFILSLYYAVHSSFVALTGDSGLRRVIRHAPAVPAISSNQKLHSY
jgi:hypothetical protein